MANKVVSVVNGVAHSAYTTPAELNAWATDFISAGVVDTITNTSGVAPATGAFAVNAQSSPDMTVKVNGGVAYVTATPAGDVSQKIRVSMDAFENVTISANSSGSTQYDWLYLKIDGTVLASPNSTKTDVATLVTVRSTSNTVEPVGKPTYGLLLAVITVANGALNITNGTIADLRTQAGAITANLTPSAITLGYAEITSSATTTTAGSYVDVPGLSVTVTVPTGGRKVRITAWTQSMNSSQLAGNGTRLAIFEGATQLSEAAFSQPLSNYAEQLVATSVSVPSAGVHTYKVSFKQDAAGTLVMFASSTIKPFILVEAI